MLPFMKPKKIASIIMQKRNEQSKVTSETEEGQENSKLMEHSRALLSAISNKDEQATASALKAIHEHLDSDTEDPGPAGDES